MNVEIKKLIVEKLEEYFDTLYRGYTVFSRDMAIYLARKAIDEVLTLRGNDWEEEKVYKVKIQDRELVEFFLEASKGEKIIDSSLEGCVYQ